MNDPIALVLFGYACFGVLVALLLWAADEFAEYRARKGRAKQNRTTMKGTTK